MSSKICTKCKKLLPLSAFYNCKNYKDGKHFFCKICSEKKAYMGKCVVCNKDMYVQRGAKNRKTSWGRGQRYCSRQCLSEFLKHRKFTEEHKAKMSQSKIGEKNPAWKGGRILNNGYVFVLNRNHPNCLKNGKIAEHRLIMEKYLNRYLTKKEIVHHINGKVADNRIENLQLCSGIAEHIAIHRKLKKEALCH